MTIVQTNFSYYTCNVKLQMAAGGGNDNEMDKISKQLSHVHLLEAMDQEDNYVYVYLFATIFYKILWYLVFNMHETFVKTAYLVKTLP